MGPLTILTIPGGLTYSNLAMRVSFRSGGYTYRHIVWCFWMRTCP